MYFEDEHGGLRFYPLPTPSTAEVALVAQRTARRLHRAFAQQARQSPWDDEHAWGDSGEGDPASTASLLAKHGLAPQPPPERPSPIALSQLPLPFG